MIINGSLIGQDLSTVKYIDLSQYNMTWESGAYRISSSDFTNLKNKINTLFNNNKFNIIHWFDRDWLINTASTLGFTLYQLPTFETEPQVGAAGFYTNQSGTSLTGYMKRTGESWLETIPISPDDLTQEETEEYTYKFFYIISNNIYR